MSTFKGVIDEFPDIRIDYFRTVPDRRPPLACFLSHIHSDHLQGLECLKSPFIYCSPATRELLLRLEKKFHRLIFEQDILECRKQHFKHVKSILKTIPLGTPTEIELSPGKSIQVTLLDANHCSGAVMFLIEDKRKAILYTGDIRSEPWWVNALVRNPVVVPYTALGHRSLDKIYLDTTYAAEGKALPAFPSKAEGVAELLRQVSKYPKDTIFHFHAWTPGYEEVWIALANALGSQIHVDKYKMGLYRSLRRTQTIQTTDKNGKGTSEAKIESFLAPEAAALCGHQCGNNARPGCLTSDQKVRLHSCEAGTECETMQSADVVWITPIITRFKNGVDVLEMGAGGGGGDLTQAHELYLDDQNVALELLALCLDGVEDSARRQRIIEVVKKLIHAPSRRVLLADLGITPPDHDISLEEFADLIRNAAKTEQSNTQAVSAPVIGNRASGKQQVRRTIQFPYSRHSSYEELCHIVSVFKPKDIYPCTTDETSWSQEVSIRTLFGHLCSGDTFSHDVEMEQLQRERQALGIRKRRLEEASSQNDQRTSSQPSAATEESREVVNEATMPQRPNTTTPSPKRRRTDGGDPRIIKAAQSASASTTQHSTFSGPRRLQDMQRSFESYFAQPSSSPSLQHSASDPSPLLLQITSKHTTPIKKADVERIWTSSIPSPGTSRRLNQTPSSRPKSRTSNNKEALDQAPSEGLPSRSSEEGRNPHQAPSRTSRNPNSENDSGSYHTPPLSRHPKSPPDKVPTQQPSPSPTISKPNPIKKSPKAHPPRHTVPPSRALLRLR